MTFEGPEGAGKSTQVELLRAALADRSPVVTREPGGTPLGERIRDLLLHAGVDMTPEAEMLLFMASRAELVSRVIAPALAAGRIVIADRYHDTTLAYQGGARGVATWWPESFPRPDRTFLLDLPASAGLDRLRASGRPADRLEAEGLTFHEAVVRAYRRLVEAEPDRWVVLDAGQQPQVVHGAVMASLGDLLPSAPSAAAGRP
ncbi:MAG TPA: dTMP kinase [Candidatus Dormibacteraeota bacterium]|nr:dTMP kinase [Candidatus Dormibacteraeota bacterium]